LTTRHSHQERPVDIGSARADTEGAARRKRIQASSAIAIAILVLQPLYFYRRVVVYNTVHIPFDIQGFHLPLTWFIARCVREHILPLWNPFAYCGLPIHADIQAQLFYPFTWLSILAANLTGGKALFYWLEWQEPIHMILGGVFAYLLFRKLRCSAWVSLFGATTYQLGPFFVSQAEHLGAICSAAWFPLTCLCLVELAERPTRRWFAILALSIALSLLSGFPATTIVVVVLCGLALMAAAIARLCSWRLLVIFAAACMLAVIVSAVQLIPTFQLTHLSIASIRWQWKDAGGLPWESLASFFWPNYYHIFSFADPHLYTLPYDFTQMYTYCGHLPLVLILISPFLIRRSKLLGISFLLMLLSVIWLLGKNTPLYPPVYKVLPKFLQGAIYAEYAMLGFSLFAAITAALVLSRFEARIPRAVLIVLVIASSWNLIRVGANRGFNTSSGGYQVATESWQDNGLPMPETLRQWTRAATPPLRTDFLAPEDITLRSRAEIDELPSADGDNPFLPLRYYRLRLTYSGEVFWSRAQLLHSLDSPWTRALNVGFVIGSGNAPVAHLKQPDEYEVLDLKSPRIYRVKNPLPRFYLANRIRSVNNEAEALAAAKDKDFDPTQETIVEGLPSPAPATGGGGSVEVVSYGNNRIELDVNSQTRGLLVASETLYPGWVATVNGRTTEILPTNVAFRGIPVEAGAQRVVMKYRPYGLIWWAILSAVALCFTLALMRHASEHEAEPKA
jgi:hypothetical protein